MENDRIETSYTAFEKLIGEEFSLLSEDQPVRLKLTHVSRLQPATNRADLGIRQDPFSLLFKELTDFQPPQKTYTVESESGTVDLFLVRVGFGEYEAIFN